jgi:MFS family permease
MASKSHSNKIRKASAHPTALKRALDESTLGAAHWKVWGLSATGVMLDGFDLFVIGIALPLIKLQWDLSALQVGAIACAAVFGSMFGAVFGGVLTDRFGRKAIYLMDLMVFIVGSLLCAFATGPWSLILFRFFLALEWARTIPFAQVMFRSSCLRVFAAECSLAHFHFKPSALFWLRWLALFYLASLRPFPIGGF